MISNYQPQRKLNFRSSPNILKTFKSYRLESIGIADSQKSLLFDLTWFNIKKLLNLAIRLVENACAYTILDSLQEMIIIIGRRSAVDLIQAERTRVQVLLPSDILHH